MLKRLENSVDEFNQLCDSIKIDIAEDLKIKTLLKKRVAILDLNDMCAVIYNRYTEFLEQIKDE